MRAQPLRAVRGLRDRPPVRVGRDRAVIGPAQLRPGQALAVVADAQHELVGHEPLSHQIQCQRVGHLQQHEPGLVKDIRLLQHLPGAEAVRLRAVGLDIGDRARLPAPRVVDQQLRLHAEHPVEQIFVIKFVRPAERAAGDITHRIEALRLELPGVSAADAPEIGQRPVAPERLPVAALVERGDAHAVFIRRGMLGADVHGDLGQIQVRPDPGGRGDAGRAEHVEDHRPGQRLRVPAVETAVGRHVDEDLVDGVDMDVLRRDIFEVDPVDLRGDLHIQRHPRPGDDEVQRQLRLRRERVGVAAAAGQRPAGCAPPPLGVHLPHTLVHLKQPRPAPDPIRLQRRRDRQADRLLRPLLIGHDEIRLQRVESPRRAFHRRIEGFEIDGKIGPVRHPRRLLSAAIIPPAAVSGQEFFEYLFDFHAEEKPSARKAFMAAPRNSASRFGERFFVKPRFET